MLWNMHAFRVFSFFCQITNPSQVIGARDDLTGFCSSRFMHTTRVIVSHTANCTSIYCQNSSTCTYWLIDCCKGLHNQQYSQGLSQNRSLKGEKYTENEDLS